MTDDFLRTEDIKDNHTELYCLITLSNRGSKAFWIKHRRTSTFNPPLKASTWQRCFYQNAETKANGRRFHPANWPLKVSLWKMAKSGFQTNYERCTKYTAACSFVTKKYAGCSGCLVSSEDRRNLAVSQRSTVGCDSQIVLVPPGLHHLVKGSG